MAVTEKYRCMRDFTFNGRKFKAGDAIARSYIVEAAPEKEGTLLRSRFIEAVNYRPDSLDDRTKAELVDFAGAVGASVSSAWKKADIIDAIKEKL